MDKVAVIRYSDKYYYDVINLELKPADKKEIEDANGFPMPMTLRKTIETQGENVYLIMYNNKVSGIFGVAKGWQEGIGIGYLLTDNNLEHYKWEMARNTLATLLHLLEDYDVITNYVSSEHAVSIRWLKRFGARFDDKDYRLHNEDVVFYRFEIRKEDYE